MFILCCAILLLYMFIQVRSGQESLKTKPPLAVMSFFSLPNFLGLIKTNLLGPQQLWVLLSYKHYYTFKYFKSILIY